MIEKVNGVTIEVRCNHEQISSPEELRMKLPYPPSANKLWRVKNSIVYQTKEYKIYKDRVWLEVMKKKHHKFTRLRHPDLLIDIKAYQAIGHKMDLDNTLKGLLDALQHGQAYENDRQIKKIIIELMPYLPRDQPSVVDLVISPIYSKHVDATT